MFVTSRHSEYFDCEGAKSVFKTAEDRRSAGDACGRRLTSCPRSWRRRRRPCRDRSAPPRCIEPDAAAPVDAPEPTLVRREQPPASADELERQAQQIIRELDSVRCDSTGSGFSSLDRVALKALKNNKNGVKSRSTNTLPTGAAEGRRLERCDGVRYGSSIVQIGGEEAPPPRPPPPVEPPHYTTPRNSSSSGGAGAVADSKHYSVPRKFSSNVIRLSIAIQDGHRLKQEKMLRQRDKFLAHFLESGRPEPSERRDGRRISPPHQSYDKDLHGVWSSLDEEDQIIARQQRSEKNVKRGGAKLNNHLLNGRRYFGESDGTSGGEGGRRPVRRPSGGGGSTAAAHSLPSSANSSDGPVASRVSAGSGRSVFLHATTVADIPPPSVLEQTAPTGSRANLAAPLPARERRKVARSFSLVAPFRPKNTREKEIVYENQTGQANGRPPRPPQRVRRDSRDSQLDEPPGRPVRKRQPVTRSVSMPKDARPAGFFRSREKTPR
ncbi:hypothetical protein FJT64_008222 [Amphibalanus amphitrite]|uniref:Uncharacterized protein n=1 Tax=Amphibalanus amphitrite TaxID=1232801 RepID=A0A6A4VR98_AMPAM|nr:hypothetical protein FJT64_008222 [Amphibalanus amphitrite]